MIWILFVGLVLAMLAMDLFVAHRKAHVVSIREALTWSLAWAGVAMLFAVFVYYGYEHHWMGLGTAVDAADELTNDGKTATAKYLTGYVVEKSLSVDNIFVIAAMFAAFGIPAIYQHRLLFWGILGALIMRGIMIGVGAELVSRYHWILYAFGVFLILTAIRMLIAKESTASPEENILVRILRRWLPVTSQIHGGRLLARENQRWFLTPLAVSLLAVEGMDAVFAVDSIPAVFGITADPFLVFTSNVFAMLGLRSLYFALAGMMQRFVYLKAALAVVLALVGVKMIAHAPLEQMLGDSFNFVTLAVILLVLTSGVVASMLLSPKLATRA